MTKNILTLGVTCAFTLTLSAQVGINTDSPQTTLDVVGAPTDTSKFDGIIAPRISGDQLKAKNYTTTQKGAIVYVTAPLSTTPLITDQTSNVVTDGYYYFDGSFWIKQGGDWHTTGNTDQEISTSSEVLGSTVASQNYLGTKSNDNLVMAIAGLSRAILDTNGILNGGGTDGDSYFMWGSKNSFSRLNAALGAGNAIIAGYKNSLVNSNIPATTGTVSNVILGRENTVTNSGLAIGYKNTLTQSTAFGRLNTLIGADAYAMGFNNSSNGGAIMIFGQNFLKNATLNTTVLANTTAYSNAYHYFQTQDSSGNMGFAKLGVNLTPDTAQESDFKVSRTVQVSPNGASATTCNAINEGSVRYITTGNTAPYGVFQGCRRTVQTPNATYTAAEWAWTTLN